MIGLFYPSLHLNPRNPRIKAFIFSLLMFFGSLLASGYHKEMNRRSRPKEEHCLMLNLVLEKRASKDRDRSLSSITRPRTGFLFGRNIYSRNVFSFYFYFYFYFYFSFIIVVWTSPPHASLTLTLAVHSSVATTIYFLIFPSYCLHFHLY